MRRLNAETLLNQVETFGELVGVGVEPLVGQIGKGHVAPAHAEHVEQAREVNAVEHLYFIHIIALPIR